MFRGVLVFLRFFAEENIFFEHKYSKSVHDVRRSSYVVEENTNSRA